MAIQSINTLQNKDNYNSVAELYLLESLANLGQRYNVKGDSISTKELTIDNLFDNSLIDEDTVLVVTKNDSDNSYRIYLVEKDEYGNWDMTVPKSGCDVLDTNENELSLEDGFNIPSKSGILYSAVHIKYENGYYDIYGRQDYNTVTDKTNFFFHRYRKSDNKLVRGIRIYKKHFSETSFNDNYLLVQLSENTANPYEYDLKMFISVADTETITDADIYEYVENINISNGVSSDSMFISIDDSFSDDAKTVDYNNNMFDISVELRNEFPTESENDRQILSKYVIYSFSDDNINLYPYCLEKYSTSKFGTIKSIYIELLKSLYDTIKKEEPNMDYLFIPCMKDDSGTLFSINYTYNTNNPNVIYFSGKEIEVTFIEDNIDSVWMNLNFDKYRNTIFAHTDKAGRTSFYFFETSINQQTELVEGIETILISTLPYIDDNGYWIINGRDTGILAKGKNAGNPNIIIVETTSAGDNPNIRSISIKRPNILVGAKKDEILNRLDWDSSIAYIEPLEKINLDTVKFKTEYDYLQVWCQVPHVKDMSTSDKDKYCELLENALLICISPISMINYTVFNEDQKSDIEEMYGKYGVISTFWSLSSETGEFEYIRKQNSTKAAFDFNYLSNLNNLIQHAVKNAEALHPDNYLYTQLVFDSIYSTLKNNTEAVNSYVFPNLINKKSSEYGISNYNNDINFVFKANDTLRKSGDNIESVHQSSDIRFYNAEYNDPSSPSANIVTNSLYKYNLGGVSGRYGEYIPNYTVPSLDLGEVLTRNETLLNRLNVLSFDNKGTAYLSYVGTSFDEDKGVLRIGSSNVNINMGTESLLKETDRESFIPQKHISVDFDNINLSGETTVQGNINADKNIYLEGDIWNKDRIETETNTVINDITYYTSLITPVARYIYELRDNYEANAGIVELHPNHGEVYSYSYVSANDAPEGTTNTDEYNIYKTETKYLNLNDNTTALDLLLKSSIYKYSLGKNKLYTINTIPEIYKDYNYGSISRTARHNVYFSDGIYIPVLLNNIGLEKFVDSSKKLLTMPNVEITSNMQIISANNVPLILVSSSTNLYPDKYLYDRINNTNMDSKVENIVNFTYKMFTANPLKITYYISASKLHIHIEELYSKNKFTPVKKIKNNYIF